MGSFLKVTPVSLVWEESSRLFVLQFDAASLETHTFDSEVTEEPIERGEIVTDHIVVKPAMVSFEVVLSNTPLLSLTNLIGDPLRTALPDAEFIGDGSSVFDDTRAETLFGQLYRLYVNKQILDLVTSSLGQYENMVIKRMSVPRDADRGGGVFVSLDLQNVQYVTTQTSGETAVKGKKSPRSANESETTLGTGFLG